MTVSSDLRHCYKYTQLVCLNYHSFPMDFTMFHKLRHIYTPETQLLSFPLTNTLLQTWADSFDTLHALDSCSHGCIMTHSSTEPAACIVRTCQGLLTLTVVASEGQMPHISVCKSPHPLSLELPLFNLNIHMLQLSVTFNCC